MSTPTSPVGCSMYCSVGIVKPVGAGADATIAFCEDSGPSRSAVSSRGAGNAWLGATGSMPNGTPAALSGSSGISGTVGTGSAGRSVPPMSLRSTSSGSSLAVYMSPPDVRWSLGLALGSSGSVPASGAARRLRQISHAQRPRSNTPPKTEGRMIASSALVDRPSSSLGVGIGGMVVGSITDTSAPSKVAPIQPLAFAMRFGH
eukprot:3938892-Rhodomonas_salina.3